jgi:NADH-quinone oxidoreductase subunit F
MAEAESTVMDYEGFIAGGTMLGSGGVICLDDSQCMVKQIGRLARFFAHESCAQCTQCREGTAWTTKILERIESGQGTHEDLDTLLSIADNMTAKTICVLSDSCAVPVVSGIQKFRDEFEAHISQQRCPFRSAGATLASAAA